MSTDYGVKFLKSGKTNKYLDLARELKKLWNINVTVMPIVVIALRTVLRDLEKKIGKQDK